MHAGRINSERVSTVRAWLSYEVVRHAPCIQPPTSIWYVMPVQSRQQPSIVACSLAYAAQRRRERISCVDDSKFSKVTEVTRALLRVPGVKVSSWML